MNSNMRSQIQRSKELLSKFRGIIKESDINIVLSDEVLMCFIHARKYDVHRAMKLLNHYVRMTKNYPDLKNLHPLRVKHVLDKGHVLSLPCREQNGRRVLILNLRNWDLTTCSLEDMIRCVVFCFQRLVCEVETQTNGIVAIIDVKDFTLHHVGQFTPNLIKKIADIVQDVFPIRLQGIHIVHEPRIIKILVAIFWPFLSNKIRSRLFFHGQSFATLHQHIDPACLPSDYDGSMKSMETMHFSNVFAEKNYSQLFDCFD
ncbi:hypothetical protein GHT06_013559 [Daphnia sinensis]|uniref:CRAL-TRIO domain-containing protein n=1 Tax=Daphnia sinensis TaxID=1820382 RepID=A0AAD5KU16_9CRUS|nr:hypothetical protein GHT06_013559 [Daphnia sinensis]